MPSAEDCTKFWIDNGFRKWEDLTVEEKERVRKETFELDGADDEEYAKFVWLLGYGDAWYFMDPTTNPWRH